MGRHRALLIGASGYEVSGVSSLPFIPDDLARLGTALKERGFDEVQVLAAREGGKQVSANYVNARVIGFLKRARQGDTLLIFLSGHGVHSRGRDYLVPEDIDEDTHPFESGCVAIDWRQHLDETLAGHVVFLIDACREGIEQASMGMAGVQQWSRQKISAALRRKVAYVYACSPGQLALFVRAQESPIQAVEGIEPGESFSLFSRSVSDAVSVQPATGMLALDEFKETVQGRMAELHRAYAKRGAPQTLRVVTDISSGSFYFLPSSKAGPTAAPPSSSAPNGALSDVAGIGAGRHAVRSRRQILAALALVAVLTGVGWGVFSHFTGTGSSTGNSLLEGAKSSFSGNVDLSKEGKIDWVQWGYLSKDRDVTAEFSGGPAETECQHLNVYCVTRKADSFEIGDFRSLGTEPPTRLYAGRQPVSFSWTGGSAPHQSASGVRSVVYQGGPGAGFRVLVPTTATTRTFRLYVSYRQGGIRFSASLRGDSSHSYTDTADTESGELNTSYFRVYKLTCRTPEPSLLEVNIKLERNHGGGNVTLMAATLQ
ncbi:caspase domain-containing protein [Streptomyces sp. AHU1]|uniref:caspase family protein n=1 Tax=Streptomyces sp. AHU1 TaxID=3377215 RepID=UPI003877A159